MRAEAWFAASFAFLAVAIALGMAAPHHPEFYGTDFTIKSTLGQTMAFAELASVVLAGVGYFFGRD